jgi:saccharopine dehydrogenase-like NADP-dependent oxidoreductase
VNVLVVGAGGVGSAIAAVAQHRSFFARMTLADIDVGRAESAVLGLSEPDRFSAARVDASDTDALVAAARAAQADVIVNAADPRFNPQIFAAAFEARCTYLDMAMTLSEPHPEDPYERPGVMLGERQFAEHERWQEAGLLALVGMGVEPGLSDVFARYAADHLFSSIDEIGVRDGTNLVVEGYTFAPTFSIWTTIEECLNPPLVWNDPAGLGNQMTGETCAGTFVSGTGTHGSPRSVYLYHVADNEETMREYGCQAVVWQTAINPVLALELLEDGSWKGTGVLGPEAFDAEVFLDRMRSSGWDYGIVERSVAGVA